MRKLAALLLSITLLLASVIPSYGQSRKKSRFGRKARTVAIIAGGAALGFFTGGLGLAAVGAGGSGLYAFNRRAARRHFKPSTRQIGTVASGTALGAGVGSLVGGKQAAAIGAAAGGGGSYLYTRTKHARRRY
jgi:hypothetical protein